VLTHAAVDACVVVDHLVAHPALDAAWEASDAVAPAMLDAELLHAVTRYVRRGDMIEERGRHPLGRLSEGPIERFPIARWSSMHGRYATT
jgi:hypothetical protein